MKKIKLTRGKVALVDDEDFEKLSKWKWYCTASGYASRKQRFFNKLKNYYYHKDFYMSREIMNTPEDLEVDHINHDRLDNRKVNLRNCNRGENNQNRDLYSNLGFKGVSRSLNKFFSQMWYNGRYIYIGTFTTINEAAEAFNIAVRYTRKNFNYGDCILLNDVIEKGDNKLKQRVHSVMERKLTNKLN